jgi:hypothetical protein
MPLVVTTAVNVPAAVGFVENVTVSAVKVAAVTVPTAPLLNVTVLFAAVVSNPAPLIVIVLALAAKFAVLLVITKVTLATGTALPLLTPLVVTVAVKLPTRGLVENVTVSAVAVAAVTVPTAPLLRVTVLLPGVVLKPNPFIVSVVSLAALEATLLVTTGFTVATCTADPLITLLVVTVAVKLPTTFGCEEKVTVSEDAVAAVTVPAAPLLNTTVLFVAVVSKPEPLIVMIAALIARLFVLLVTTGFTVATWTAEPLLTLFVVTMAVKFPAFGCVENVTVRTVAVADVTVPTAPLLKTTELFAAVVSNPNPLIASVVVANARLTVLLVTTGMTVATCTADAPVTPLVVTVAVKFPTDVGFTENATVKAVAVAEVTVPTAPRLNVTVLLLAVVSNPSPLIVIVLALAAKLLVLEVTTC